MSKHPRPVAKKVVVVAGISAGLISLGLGVSALANASGGAGNPSPTPTPGIPGNMQLGTSADETIDKDGTQGSFAPAVQGTQDSDGDEDAHSSGSFEAVPQKW